LIYVKAEKKKILRPWKVWRFGHQEP